MKPPQLTAVGNCSSRRAARTLKLTGVKISLDDNWWNIVNSEKQQFRLLSSPWSTPTLFFFFFFSFLAGYELQSQKAQLASEEGGQAAEWGWGGGLRCGSTLAPPESCKAHMRHTKHGASEWPFFVLALSQPFSHTQHGPNRRLYSCRIVWGQFSRGLPAPRLLPPCLARPPLPLPPAPLLLRVSCWAVMATGPPLPKWLPGGGAGAGPAPEGTAESRSSGGGLLWGRGGSLSASPSFSAARRIPGTGARRAPGASPERGGQARQPWGRSARHHCTLRQAPRDAPWEPRAEATLSGEPREDVAGTADARLASAVSVRGPGSPVAAREAGWGAGSPGPACRPPRGTSLGPEPLRGGPSWDLDFRSHRCLPKMDFLP